MLIKNLSRISKEGMMKDDDLAILRQAALKTLKPKAQPIQKVVTLSGGNRSQPIAQWGDYPASADIVPEFQFQPEPLPEPEAFPAPNLSVHPSALQPPVAMPGLQIVPTQVALWRQPYTNGVQGPRSFRPQGFILPHRRPFQHGRGPHRTFGDRGRPPLNRGRFSRSGYMPDRGVVGQFNRPRGPALTGQKALEAEAPAGGNLIVIRPKQAQPPDEKEQGRPLPGRTVATPQVKQAEESKPKLLLPQDKYHSSTTVSDTTITSQNTQDSTGPAKPRDKFSRYNDSDSDEDEEEEDHSDTEDITQQIDNFLNDDEELDSLAITEDTPSEAATQDKTPQVESIGDTEEGSPDLEQIVEDVDLASDAESLDLDALASGDMPVVFEDGVGGKVVDGTCSEVGRDQMSVSSHQREKETRKASGPDRKTENNEKDVADSLTSPKSSSSSSSSSSSESGDSSSEGEEDERKKTPDLEGVDSDSSDLDNIVNSEVLGDINNRIESSPKERKISGTVSTKRLSPRQTEHHLPSPSLSPKPTSPPQSKGKQTSVHHRSKSTSPNPNHRQGSVSPKRPVTSFKKSPRPASKSPPHSSHSPSYREERRIGSPRHTLRSPRYSEDSRRRSPRERRISPGQSISPKGGSRLKPFSSRVRSTSPLRRLSPRHRSRSPQRHHLLARHRSKSPRDRHRRYQSPTSEDRSRREQGHRDRESKHVSGRPGGRDRYQGSNSGHTNKISRSHSRERYTRPLEVRSSKEFPSKIEPGSDKGKAKKVESPPPQIDMEKLTPEEREKIEARRKKFSCSKVVIDSAKKVSLKSIKERPKKKKKAKDTEPAISSDLDETTQKTSKRKHKKTLSSSPAIQTENTVDDDADNSDPSDDLGRARKQSSRTKKNVKEPDRKSKTSKRHEADRQKHKNFSGRSVKDRLGFVGSESTQAWDSDTEDARPVSQPLTSSIVKVKPSRAFVPEEKMKIEINVAHKKSKTKSKTKAKPDFSKVYSVPAKRSSAFEEVQEETAVPVKKKKHSRKIEEVSESEEEPVRQPARPSIMERLGKKVPLPELTKREKKKKRKHAEHEPATELDAKIQKIHEKNAAIARRQREIEQDKQRYG